MAITEPTAFSRPSKRAFAMARREFFSSKFHYSFGPHAPVLRISSGASLRVICPDSDNELSDGTLLSREQRCVDPSCVIEGNPLAGPIWVEGAMPGDSIAVRIDAIQLDRAYGQTGLAPNHGLLPMEALSRESEVVPKHLYRWKIDSSAGVAELSNALGTDAVRVPLSPFVGCLGTCPDEPEFVPSLFCGSFGGNLDLPVCAPGTTVYLPVRRPGALLFMGDIHAAQGHGEIIGGAIETSGKIDCTIRRMEQQPIPHLRMRCAKFLTAVASHDDLRTCVQLAYAHLLDWLSIDLKMNRWDAYNLISQTGSLMMGNLLSPPYPVGARIPISVLPIDVDGWDHAWE